MCLIEIILCAIGFGYTWVSILQMKYRYNLQPKPFNCANCMTGWACLLLCIVSGFYWQAPFHMCLAMAASSLFNSLMNRL
jgi:hypothetical protein